MAETPGKQEEALIADPILNEMIAQAPFNELERKMVAEGNKALDSQVNRYRVFVDLYRTILLRDLIQQVAKSNDRLTYIIIAVAFLQVVVAIFQALVTLVGVLWCR